MARLNVHVPDELVSAVKERAPDLNVSRLVQQALRALLECDHGRVACVDCGEEVDEARGVQDALGGFWQELLWAWQPLVDRRGTAEGAARVARDVALRYSVPNAEYLPLPRPPRARRSAA